MLTGYLVDLEPFTSEWPDKMDAFWNNESRLWAFMGDWGPVTRAQMARIRERRAESREHGYNGVHFMLRAKDGNVIGSIGLNWIEDANRLSWVGAWIGDLAYWSGGHGSDALLLLTEYAFDWLDLRRLVLGTMDLNERAQRNVEHCGFVLEGRVRHETYVNGQPVDGLLYGLLREEWKGREVLAAEMGLPERARQRYGVGV